MSSITALKTPGSEGNSFSELAGNALWGICLTLKEHVIATHQDLALLRRCAKLACESPDQMIHVVAPSQTGRTHYIVQTLMHFGVSCGQIAVRTASRNHPVPAGVWLLVGRRHLAD